MVDFFATMLLLCSRGDMAIAFHANKAADHVECAVKQVRAVCADPAARYLLGGEGAGWEGCNRLLAAELRDKAETEE